MKKTLLTIIAIAVAVMMLGTAVFAAATDTLIFTQLFTQPNETQDEPEDDTATPESTETPEPTLLYEMDPHAVPIGEGDEDYEAPGIEFTVIITPEPKEPVSSSYTFEYDPAAESIDEGPSEEEIAAIQEELNRIVEMSYLNMQICCNPRFEDGYSAGNLGIVNPESNYHPISVEIARNDTGETVYTNPYIPVGSSVEWAPLQGEPLPAGTYPCTASFHYVLDDGSLMGTVCAEIVVTVIN